MCKAWQSWGILHRGGHFTSDDMFQDTSNHAMKETIKKIVEEKKKKTVGIKLAEKAEGIWMSGKNVTDMTRPELNVLLKWYNEPKTGEGKVEETMKWLKDVCIIILHAI